MPPDLRAQEIRSFAEFSSQPETAQGSQGRQRPKRAAQADRRRPAARESSSAAEGFQAVYEIPGRVTIENTNTPKLVTIASKSLEASLSLKAVPKLDLSAYLLVRSASTAAAALLPGPVMLFGTASSSARAELPDDPSGPGFRAGLRGG